MLIKNGKLQTKQMIALVVIIFMVWLISWLLIDLFIENPESQGAFGDKFGAINALFSGFAFAGLIITLFMQRYELSMQREELELQRNEMRGTKEALEEQAQTLKHQQFENTFFNMLSLHNDIVKGLRVKKRIGSDHANDREVFSEIYSFFYNLWSKDTRDGKKVEVGTVFKKIIDEKYALQWGHYIRNLHRIFRLVEDSQLPNQLFYSKIIDAQLSDRELILLFYYTFYYDNGLNFKLYAKNYNLFRNLKENYLLNPEHTDILQKLSKNEN